MFCLGAAGFHQAAGGSAVYTVDGSLATYREHAVAVTENGPRVLTALPDERANTLVG